MTTLERSGPSAAQSAGVASRPSSAREVLSNVAAAAHRGWRLLHFVLARAGHAAPTQPSSVAHLAEWIEQVDRDCPELKMVSHVKMSIRKDSPFGEEDVRWPFMTSHFAQGDICELIVPVPSSEKFHAPADRRCLAAGALLGAAREHWMREKHRRLRLTQRSDDHVRNGIRAPEAWGNTTASYFFQAANLLTAAGFGLRHLDALEHPSAMSRQCGLQLAVVKRLIDAIAMSQAQLTPAGVTLQRNMAEMHQALASRLAMSGPPG